MNDDSVVLMQGKWPWVLTTPGEVRGRPLRYLLTTLLLESTDPLSVRELVARCEAQGVVFEGRASKVVSDALRWEVGWGRVVRVRRGIYRASEHMTPRSTRHWIRARVRQLRTYLGALRAASIEAGWVPPTRPKPGTTQVRRV